MDLAALASLPNLKLAWRRITTGGNNPYKKFFRHLYYSYELALDENLLDLQVRIRSRAWRPHSPDRLYLPKPSGLQRPLTLLHIEDQIVLQAIANVVATKVADKRKPFIFNSVFSNVLESPNSIFFIRDWHRTYSAFSSRIEQQYKAGLLWVADFDLAAFYETISHDLLLRTAFPRLRESADSEWVCDCLSTWTSQRTKDVKGHGLPQGPIASDFLAEVFLLPVDRAMTGTGGYVRYVDDVRLFASTEAEIQRAVIKLEIECRERGLIPQIGKFAIRKAKSLAEARGMLPSLGGSGESSIPRLAPKAAERLLKPALGGRPMHVVDKTRLRYVLYRANPSSRILGIVLRLLNRHPEHVDAFAAFLSQFGYRRRIRDGCLATLAATPYDYVAGEMWHILARYYATREAFSPAVRRNLVDRALTILKDKRVGTALKWGAAHFVCAAEERDGQLHTRTLRYQSSTLLQALIAPALPRTALGTGGLVKEYLRSSDIEPGLGLASPLHAAGINLRSTGLRASELRRQVRNVFRRLGLVRSASGRLDIVGDVVESRYGVAGVGGEWLRLLDAEYAHAVGILCPGRGCVLEWTIAVAEPSELVQSSRVSGTAATLPSLRNAGCSRDPSSQWRTHRLRRDAGQKQRLQQGPSIRRRRVQRDQRSTQQVARFASVREEIIGSDDLPRGQ